MKQTDTSPCHFQEMAISAFVDGELSALEQPDAVDHLVRCAACRAFYRQARDLGTLVAGREAEDELEAPPEAVWARIAAAGAAAPRRHNMLWLPQIAAALLLVFGLWAIQTYEGPRSKGNPDHVELVLGEDSGVMTEERFVALTAEVLRADRRYRELMLAVMRSVEDVTPDREVSADGFMPRDEDRKRARRLAEDHATL